MTGYRIATVDSILWRACADGVVNSRAYEVEGWKAAFRPHALEVEVARLDVADINTMEPGGSHSEAGFPNETRGE